MGIVQRQTLDSEPTVEIVGIEVEVEVEEREEGILTLWAREPSSPSPERKQMWHREHPTGGYSTCTCH
jgi:hypothetical protein